MDRHDWDEWRAEARAADSRGGLLDTTPATVPHYTGDLGEPVSDACTRPSAAFHDCFRTARSCACACHRPPAVVIPAQRTEEPARAHA